jgi:hypothetical protein
LRLAITFSLRVPRAQALANRRMKSVVAAMLRAKNIKLRADV